MAKRQQHDPRTRSDEQRREQQKRAGRDPSKERGGERDSGRSWVRDEPPLRQDDDPRRSGYSDRETPEARNSGSRPGQPGERGGAKR